MSVIGLPLPRDERRFCVLRRVLIVIAALALVCAALFLLSHFLGFDAAPKAAPKNPLGVGLREQAPTGPIGAMLLAIQSRFFLAMTNALLDARAHSSSALWLVLVGFLYGVFHSMGPGHGKSVIASFLLADKASLREGLTLSLAAAIWQACVTIGLVTCLALILRETSRKISAASNMIEILSFVAVTVFGLVLSWRKSEKIDGIFMGRPIEHEGNCGAHCLHVQRLALVPTSRQSQFAAVEAASPAPRRSSWKSIGVILAAGSRPCSGAIIFLVFALSQSSFGVGVATVIAMSLGTAVAVGGAAALTVFGRSLATKVAGGRQLGSSLSFLAGSFELLAASFIVVLGVALLSGLAGTMPT